MLEYLSALHFFLLSNSIPLYDYITFAFIHPPADGHVRGFQFGATPYKVPTNARARDFCRDTLSFLLDGCSGVALMSNKVSLTF